jgi:hypothetical protein
MGMGDTYQWAGHKKFTNRDVEQVRRSPFVYPIVQAIASDVANFNYSLKNGSYGWQADYWDWYLQEGTFQRDIQELVMWGWFYGRAYADSYIIIKDGYRVPSKFVPLHMYYVEDSQFGKEIKYGASSQGLEIRKNRLMELVMFTEAGRFYPFAWQIWQFVAMLDDAFKSLCRATFGNSSGVWVETFNSGAGAGLKSSIEARKQLKAFNQHIGASNFTAFDLPDGFDLKVLKSNTETAAFDLVIKKLLFIIYSGMRTTFLLTESTQTFGATEVQAQFYINLLKSIGQGIIIDTLNQTANKVAQYNFEPCTVSFSCSPSAYVTRAGSDFKIIDSLQKVLTMAGAGQLSPELNQALFEMMGLPVPTITMQTPTLEQPVPVDQPAVDPNAPVATQTEDETTIGDMDAIETILASVNSKNLSIFMALLKSDREEQTNKYMRLRGQEQITNALGLTKASDFSTFGAYWKAAENDINAIKSTYIDEVGKWSVIAKAATDAFNARWMVFVDQIKAKFVGGGIVDSTATEVTNG